MMRDEAIVAVAAEARRGPALVFCGNGLTPRSLATLADSDANFYMVGSMGLCSAIAAGFANISSLPVVALEGDGNALMGLSGLPAVAAAVRSPFVHVVLDNGRFETTGGQSTLSAEVDFEMLARGAGYAAVTTVDNAAHLTGAVERGLDAVGCTCVIVKTEPATGPPPPRIGYTPTEIVSRFANRSSGRAGVMARA